MSIPDARSIEFQFGARARNRQLVNQDGLRGKGRTVLCALDLLALPDEVSEDGSALPLRLVCDELALLQVARAVLKHDGSCERPRGVGRAVRIVGRRGAASNANCTPAFATGSISNSALIAGGEAPRGRLQYCESKTAAGADASAGGTTIVFASSAANALQGRVGAWVGTTSLASVR